MIIYSLLIAHFLADFTFQPTKLARNKISSFRFLLIHSFIYAGTYFVAVFSFIKVSSAILPYIIIITTHFLIDWIRTSLNKEFTKGVFEFTSFIIDQILHIAVIAFTFLAFNLQENTNHIYGQLEQWNYFETFIIYFLIFVVIWDPAAVLVKKLFLYIDDQNSNISDDNDPRTGRIIGKLERIIISLLVLCNQFGAIGFVLTAKSIARYKQLEDKNFAEKYLIGTLASTSIAFITAIVLKNLI